jgi:tRNA nucleotidyltransferase (CCA-adding enzyme)
LDDPHYGNLHDYWGGYNDIQDGLVRVLHSLSFVDDPTRMLRAVRYEQRYDFRIGKRTHQLLLEARPLLNRVSGDRIRHELDNIIKEDRMVLMLSRLNELDLLKGIHLDMIWNPWIKMKISDLMLPPQEWDVKTDFRGIPTKRIIVYTLWLIRTPWLRTEKIISRLRFSRILKRIIADACKLWSDQMKMYQAKPSEIARLLDGHHKLAIYSVYLATDNPEIKELLQTYITKWKHIKPRTTGHDLRDRNIKPGPQYSVILDKLRDAWIDGTVTSKEEENSMLDQLIEEFQENNKSSL